MSNSTPTPPVLPGPGRPRAWWRAPASPSALAWHVARAAEAHDGPLLLVARDNHGAHQLESDLRTLLGGGGALPVVPFPDWETLPYDRFSPHPDIVSQRMRALATLPALRRVSMSSRSRIASSARCTDASSSGTSRPGSRCTRSMRSSERCDSGSNARMLSMSWSNSSIRYGSVAPIG